MIEKPFNSSFTNSGTLHLYHNFTFNNGSFNLNGGALTVHPGASFNASGGTFILSAGTFNVNGIFSIGNAYTLSPTGAFTIAVGSGGAFRVNDGSHFYLPSGVVFNNAGTVTATSGTGTFHVNGGTFNNTGSLVHNSAALALNLVSGALNNNTGGAVQVQSALTVSSSTSISNAATLNLHNAATLTLPSGATLTNNGGTIGVSPGQMGILSIQSGGTVNNSGSIEHGGATALTVLLNGTFNNQNGGTFSLAQNLNLATATFNNASGAVFNLGSNQLELSGSHVFNNSGTVSGSGGTFRVNGGTCNNYGSASTQLVMAAGVFNNKSGGTFSMAGNLILAAGIFNNESGAVFNLGSNQLELSGSHVFNNSGTVNGSGGTFQVNGGTCNNYGSASTQLMLVAGVFNNGSGGTLNIVSASSMSGGTLTNNATIQLNADLLMSGGTLTNNATIQINADLVMNTNSQLLNNVGATLAIASGKTLTINASATFYDYGTMGASGTLAIAGGIFYLDGAALTHSTSGLTISYTDGFFWLQNGGSLTFNSDFTVPATRTLTMNQSTSSITNFANLTFAGRLFANDGTFTNHGTVTVNVGSTFRSSGTINQSAGLFQNNGAVYAASSFPLPTMNITGGIFRNNTNASNWLAVGGSFGVNVVLGAGGTLENTAGGTIRINTNYIYGSGIITNAGTILNNFTLTLQNGVTLANSGTFTNNFTLTIDAPSGSFTNTGTVNGNSSSTVNISRGAFHNNGTCSFPNGSNIYLTQGTFNNNATFTGGGYTQPGGPSGVFNNNAGATMTLGSQMGLNQATLRINTGGTFNNLGSLSAVNGYLKIEGGTFNNSTNIDFGVSGAAIHLDFPVGTINNLAGTMNLNELHYQGLGGSTLFFNHTGATVNVLAGFSFGLGDTFRNEGSFNRNSTQLSVLSNGALFLNKGICTYSNYTGHMGSEFRNDGGTATFTGNFNGESSFSPHLVTNLNSGVLNLNVAVDANSSFNWANSAGATINLLGNMTHYFGNLSNNGMLNLNSHTLTNLAWVANSSTGTIHTGTGMLDFSTGSLTNDGTIKGEGEILSAGGFLNDVNSQYLPGSSPGTLTITGDHVHGSATLTVEIDGTVQGTSYDWLDVSGTVTLGTSSKLHLVFGYAATDGTTFDVLTAGSVSGSFDLANISFGNVGAGNVTAVTVTYPGGNTVRVMASSALLPVELLDFTAKPDGNSVLLRWSTASELNAESFEVEHSTDGFSFVKIGERTAAGTTAEQQDYELWHEHPALGTNYYRLRQIDLDGAFEYSKVVSVDFRNQGGLEKLVRAYPNPVTDFLHIELPAEGGFQVGFFDATGRRLLSQADPKRLDVRHLPSGIYFLKIKELASGRAAVQRVVVE